MCQQLNVKTPMSVQPSRPLLTQENLRLHGTLHPRTSTIDLECQYSTNECNESDDGDLDAKYNNALRQAASLEALQAYGGCFVSGFLNMQQPLPWTLPAATITTSNGSFTAVGCPRPDSDTLSCTDTQESTESRKRNWRHMRRLRSAGRKLKR
ncbi:hypothetical protein GQ44DRAFT_774041 [Phaeosphaeriaceae sp. PMI808]|nr:hypothetical protein GQ44DRAFT_774041 [Phaeosphaeriaceae sp. PMI808]